mmetsp:Transcript_685/g.1580  ORF Transcript_685/g.1580 Transcript_685/m.1580 type:complete len:231 (-) Transcript_685:466-1158(-)
MQHHVVFADATLFLRLRDQVLVCDGNLLFKDVASYSNNFHPVEQWTRNGVGHVRSADEEHVGEIHRDIQVVIAKIRVLFGIQDLEEGRGWIASVVPAELVDLINENDWVGTLRNLQTLNELPGHRAYIGPSVSSQLRDVMHTADRESVEFSVQSSRDTRSDRGFSDAGRASEAHDFPLGRVLQERDRDMLQDSLLYIFEAIMVLVQYFFRTLDVLVLRCMDPPRKACEPF